MDAWVEQRMWANLLKGIACLAVGALAILVVEHVWHQGASGGDSEEQMQQSAEETGEQGDAGTLQSDLMRFVLEGDDAAIGLDGVSPGFVEECFDPHGLGEVRSSDDGGVVGIVSDLEAEALFDACTRKLVDHGWLQVSGGQPLRCSFLKSTGDIRWVFLDVTEIAESSAAVLVMEEVRDDDEFA